MIPASFPMKLRIVIGVAVALSLLYVGDLAALRFRHDPFGTITVQRYDAIPEKNGKVEFQVEPPVAQSCVHSFFPHQGYPPCWYLSRHTEQRINY